VPLPHEGRSGLHLIPRGNIIRIRINITSHDISFYRAVREMSPVSYFKYFVFIKILYIGVAGITVYAAYS